MYNLILIRVQWKYKKAHKKEKGDKGDKRKVVMGKMCENKASIDLKIEGKQKIETEDGKLYCLIDLFSEKIQSKRTVTLVFFCSFAGS